MNEFSLKIVTPDKEIFSGDVRSLLVRTDAGDVQILAGHADYLASIGTGRAKITLGDGTERIAACSGGFISVKDSRVSLVTVTFEYQENIDIDRAERAREHAQALIAAARDNRAEAIAKAKLQRALSRISVAKGLR